MTRYVVVTEFAPPEIGGIQASIGPLIKALGETVTVISPQSTGGSIQQIQRSLFSGSHWPRWWWLVAWYKKAQKQGLTTIIFGHYSAAVLSGYIAHHVLGLQYCILIHGNDILSEQHRFFTKLLIGPILRRAKFIGVNSAFVEDIVRAYHVPLSKIVTTHPFVSQKKIPHEHQHPVSPRLISISRLVPRKNIETVIQSLITIKKHYPTIHLDLVGDGPEHDNLVLLTKKNGLESNITFHGAVTDQVKWQLLQQASIFIMTPKIRQRGTDIEGLGLVYLEASACALPIIASDTGGIRDAVMNNRTGLLVQPNDPEAITKACIRLLEDPSFAKQLGQNGRQHILSEYTDSVRIPRFMSALQNVEPDQQPLISIIIPAFNAAETIGKTLQSIFNQTWIKYEIIVVNDGSTDDSMSALQPFMNRIQIVQQKNAGAPNARNVGFDHSSGEYLLFLDADIVLETSAIMKMATALLTHPTKAYAYSDFYFGWKKFHLFEYSSKKLRQQNFIHTSSLLRRKSFQRFDEDLKKFQDWDLWLQLDTKGDRGLWLPETLFTVHTSQKKHSISSWLPSFMYSLPGVGQGRGNATIARYRLAESIIRKKHHL